MMNEQYFKQARLMLQILPVVAEEKCFALKGGTAINFFVRDMPRYSVDIDLTYIKINHREEAIGELVQATENIAVQIERRFPSISVIRQYTKKEKRLVKLVVKSAECQVKIEPNELIRGALYPVAERRLAPAAEQKFEQFVSMQVLSNADLYGGKFCAALDRQHPRDLFDVKLLFDNEGITDDIRRAFVIYLASHNRPMAELLQPNLLEISDIYENGFVGMTSLVCSFDDLLEARHKLIRILNEDLTENERKFLLSIKLGEPEWGLIDIQDTQVFPAIQWKLLNIKMMDKAKHIAAVEKLRAVLQL